MDKHALAAFPHSRRERIRPQDVGLPRGPRRRTPGLRREEVAQLAHISTDHYSRLEQARGRHPSRQVLQGIARALRLSDQERSHLFSLADEPAQAPGRAPSQGVDRATALLLHRLADTPALVLDHTCRVLAWNPLAAALFEGFSALGAADRNILRRSFLRQGGDGGAYEITDHRRFVTAAVSYPRGATARHPHSAELRSLIADLLAGSAGTNGAPVLVGSRLGVGSRAGRTPDRRGPKPRPEPGQGSTGARRTPHRGARTGDPLRSCTCRNSSRTGPPSRRPHPLRPAAGAHW